MLLRDKQLIRSNSLNDLHWLRDTIQWKQPQLWAMGDWQLHHNNAPTHASCLVQSFMARHQITQVTQPHYSPDLAPCDVWLFPKLKSPLKGKRFQTIDEIQENTTGLLMAIGRTVWGAYFEGDWGVIVLCTMFLVSCIFKKCLYFSYYMVEYLLDRPCIYKLAKT